MLAVRCWRPYTLPLRPFSVVLYANATSNQRYFATKKTDQKSARVTTLAKTPQDANTILKKDDAVQLVSGVLGLVEDYLKRVDLAETAPKQATMTKSAIQADSLQNTDGENTFIVQDGFNLILNDLRSEKAW
jgi:hypothetical protein